MTHLVDDAFERELREFLEWQSDDRRGAPRAADIAQRLDVGRTARHSGTRLAFWVAGALLAGVVIAGALISGGSLLPVQHVTPIQSSLGREGASPGSPMPSASNVLPVLALTGNGDIYVAGATEPNPSSGPLRVVPLPQAITNACTGCAAAGTVAWSPDGSTLAYADGDGQLWIWRDGDAEATSLIACPQPACPVSFPGWSADGGSILFIGGGQPTGGRGLYAIDLATRAVRSIPLPAGAVWPSSLSMSRSGRIAFTTIEPPPLATVWVANADGSGARSVPGAASTRLPTVALSPDGSRLAIVEDPLPANATGGGDPYEIQLSIIGADGAGRRVLYRHPGCCVGLDGFGPPVWSPDGTKVAIVALRPSSGADASGIAVLSFDVASGDESVLAPAQPNGAMPAWRPAPTASGQP
jgi:hypothetical protein